MADAPPAAAAPGPPADADLEAGQTRTLNELPGLALHAIATALYPDARAALRLSAACRALRAVDCDGLWAEWVGRRFGREALPAAPPAGPVRAADVRGFVFVQGMEPPVPPATVTKSMPGAPPAALAEATLEAGKRHTHPCASPRASATAAQRLGCRNRECRAPRRSHATLRAASPPRPLLAGSPSRRAAFVAGQPTAGAQAFTTGGRILQGLPPEREWRRASLDPREGVYVAQAAARTLSLSDQPAPQAHDTWPPAPDERDWVYVPGVAFGPALSPMHDFLQEVDSIPALLARAAELPDCAAVTTDGKALRAASLPPRWAWRRRGEWGRGVFLRPEAAQELAEDGAAAPEPDNGCNGDAVKQIYLRRSALAVDAVDMDAVWLDNQHLSLANTVPRPVPRPGPSAGPLALEPSLVLDSVCWLEVAGEITGVLPGTYQVAWCVDVAHCKVELMSRQPLRLWAGVFPAGAGAAAAEAEATCGNRELRNCLGQLGMGGPGDNFPRVGHYWAWMLGPKVAVPASGDGGGAPARVRVRFYSHTDRWKSAIKWAFAQLLPVADGAERARLPRLPGADGAGGGDGGDGWDGWDGGASGGSGGWGSRGHAGLPRGAVAVAVDPPEHPAWCNQQ